MTDGPHRNLNPVSLARPSGFSHATEAAPGRLLFLGGQTGHAADDSIPSDLVEQFDRAAANVAQILKEAGGEPEHIVALTIYATDLGEYRERMKDIGRAYRRRFGKHYPAMALIGVSELVDPSAHVELVATAVIP